MAAMMFGFFFVQGVFVLAEIRLGTTKWPPMERRRCGAALFSAESAI